jgi:hypothetical protein
MSQLQCTGDSRCTQMCSMGRRSIVVCIIFCTREVTNPTGADGHGHASAMAWRCMYHRSASLTFSPNFTAYLPVCLSVCLSLSLSRAGVIRKTHVVESSFFDVPLLHSSLKTAKKSFLQLATDQVDKETQ